MSGNYANTVTDQPIVIFYKKTLDFLEHAHSNLNDKGIAIFHEAYNNSWLGLKKRSDWGTIPTIFQT